MITAHLPSGYILSEVAGWRGVLLIAACFGAVWPDFDLLSFYFVDNKAIHHHRYWVHAPAFALVVSAALWAVAGPYRRLVLAFAGGWCLHIVLDTPVGGIMWMWPVSNELFVLIDVPSTQHHWLVSFLIHPSILAEVAIWLAAALFFLRRRHAT